MYIAELGITAIHIGTIALYLLKNREKALH